MNRITGLFETEYPVIQAGMIWCSGWKLAAAVSKAGGLGLIGAGSMDPDTLRHHIRACRAATDKPFGVNIPLLFRHTPDFMQIVTDEKVPVVFTSAGNPAKYTGYLKEQGTKVVHVVASEKSARKCEESGVDAVVAEGFEAGGHNGKEETTTMVLVPAVVNSVKIPVIAAGGIGCGKTMLAAFALGAEGVQIGSRFVTSEESSAHLAFKNKVIEAGEGDTRLMVKSLIPVRLMKNAFFHEMEKLEARGAGSDEILALLGSGRAKLGMFDGNLDEGELEIGQVSSMINRIMPAAEIVQEIMSEFQTEKDKLSKLVL